METLTVDLVRAGVVVVGEEFLPAEDELEVRLAHWMTRRVKLVRNCTVAGEGGASTVTAWYTNVRTDREHGGEAGGVMECRN